MFSVVSVFVPGEVFFVCLALFACLGVTLSWVHLLASSSSACPTLQVFLLLFYSCSFFVLCQSQCGFKLEGVAQYSLSLRPTAMLPLINSLEVS